jgi:hypothetical protein
MKLINKATYIYTLPSFPGACGVTPLDHEAFDDPVEEGAIIVTLETELKEVAASTWCLLCPKVNLNVAIVSL